MHKLVIVFYAPATWTPFEQGWQKFLGLAEQMPGLCKEVVSDPEQHVFGSPNHKIRKIHELYFNSREELEAALNDEAGQKAGQWLHSFAQGQFLLMIAKHMEAAPDQFKKLPEETSQSP